MQNFQEFVREQQIDSQYPNWTNNQRDVVLELRWRDENNKKPTRYVKYVKRELIKLSNTTMSPMEKLKFVAQKWRTTKYYKTLLLEKDRIELEFPGISNNDAFSIANYRLTHKKNSR
jgi:hypothetical protein